MVAVWYFSDVKMKQYGQVIYGQVLYDVKMKL